MSPAPVGGTPRWRQVPGLVAAGPSWETALLAWVLTALPMAVQFTRLQYTPASWVPALLAALVVALAVRLHWLAGLAAAALAVPAVMLRDSVFSGAPVLLMLAVVVMWTVATGAFRLRWSRWPAPPARRLVVLAMLLVTASLLLQTGVRVPMALVGVAGLAVLACLAAPGPVGRAMSALDPVVRGAAPLVRANRWVIEKLGHVLGTAVGFVAMLPVALLTLLVWLVQRVVRFDPLDPPVHDGTRWVERTGDDAEPGRAFARVTVRDPRGGGFRTRKLAASTLTGVAFLGIGAVAALSVGIGQGTVDSVAAQLSSDEDRATVTAANCGGEENGAMGAQDSWPLVGCETTEFALRARFDGATTYRFEDYEGTWVNVKDGVRRTWQPPACDCRRLTVWWFGGSAAWGYYQGDLVSLPSQVARQAWEQGIALDIVNYAAPGWTLGQGVRKFAELTTTEPAPDIAVFMDGANDVVLQRDRNNQGRGTDESEIAFAESTIDKVLRYGPFDWGLQAPDRDEGKDPLQSDVQVARHAMNRFARNVKLGETVASAVGTTPVFFLQPILPTAPRRIGAANALSVDDAAQWKVMSPEMRRRVPKGVVDLSDALDGVDRPVYKDYVHVNEYGAKVLAGQMLKDLGPSIAAAQAAPPKD